MSAQEAIRVFSICFYVSLGLMAVGFGFAIFAFFKYRIPQVFALMTGKAQKKTIEKMRSSGQLQTEEEIEAEIQAESYTASSAELRQQPQSPMTGATRSEPAEETSLLSEVAETEVLQREAEPQFLHDENPGGKGERLEEDFSEFAGETERLDHPPRFDMHPQAGAEATKHPIGRFETIEHQMVLHTDEQL